MNLRGAVTGRSGTKKWYGQTLSHGSVRVLMTTIRYRQCPRDLVPGRNAKNATNRTNLGVSLGLTNSFYTKHGVPIEEDKTWDYANRFEVQAPTPVEG